MGIKIPEVLATKFNFVKRIDFSYNDGTINSSLPEVASLTFTYIETIDFAEVASLITSSSCKTRDEVRVSIHHDNPKVQGTFLRSVRGPLKFSRVKLSAAVHLLSHTRGISRTLATRSVASRRIAADISVHRYRHRHSDVESRPGRTQLDIRIDSGFHGLQWLRAHAPPPLNQSAARVERSEGRAGCRREAERADRVAAKAQNHYHARPRGEQTCFSFTLSSVEISCRSVFSLSSPPPVLRAPPEYTRV